MYPRGGPNQSASTLSAWARSNMVALRIARRVMVLRAPPTKRTLSVPTDSCSASTAPQMFIFIRWVGPGGGGRERSGPKQCRSCCTGLVLWRVPGRQDTAHEPACHVAEQQLSREQHVVRPAPEELRRDPHRLLEPCGVDVTAPEPGQKPQSGHSKSTHQRRSIAHHDMDHVARACGNGAGGRRRSCLCRVKSDVEVVAPEACKPLQDIDSDAPFPLLSPALSRSWRSGEVTAPWLAELALRVIGLDSNKYPATNRISKSQLAQLCCRGVGGGGLGLRKLTAIPPMQAYRTLTEAPNHEARASSDVPFLGYRRARRGAIWR